MVLCISVLAATIKAESLTENFASTAVVHLLHPAHVVTA